jgi:hypothetical protein
VNEFVCARAADTAPAQIAADTSPTASHLFFMAISKQFLSLVCRPAAIQTRKGVESAVGIGRM